MGCVYVATNLINGKQYVGQTTQSFEARKAAHLTYSRHPNSVNHYILHQAIAKYGEVNFQWIIAFESDIIEELRSKEKELIALLDTFNNGYNLTNGGEEYYRGGPATVQCIECHKSFEVSRQKYNSNIKSQLNFICSSSCGLKYKSTRASGVHNPNYRHGKSIGRFKRYAK